MGLKCQQSLGWSRAAACGLGVGAVGKEVGGAGQALLATTRSFDMILRALGEPWEGYKQ